MRCRARALSPMASIAAAGGPTKIRPASATAVANARVLGQEAVARVDRLRAAGARRGDDLVDHEVRLGRQVAADRHVLVAGRDDAAGRGRRRSRRRRWRCPSAVRVRAMRTAISPRLAISSRFSVFTGSPAVAAAVRTMPAHDARRSRRCPRARHRGAAGPRTRALRHRARRAAALSCAWLTIRRVARSAAGSPAASSLRSASSAPRNPAAGTTTSARPASRAAGAFSRAPRAASASARAAHRCGGSRTARSARAPRRASPRAWRTLRPPRQSRGRRPRRGRSRRPWRCR